MSQKPARRSTPHQKFLKQIQGCLPKKPSRFAATTGGGLSGSKAAKPIAAFIFPVAGSVIIERDKPDHVLTNFEAELGRNAHAHGKDEFRRQDLSIVLEGQLCLRMQRRGHTDGTGTARASGPARSGAPSMSLAPGATRSPSSRQQFVEQKNPAQGRAFRSLALVLTVASATSRSAATVRCGVDVAAPRDGMKKSRS
jgi:hypothetical protein